MKKKISLLLCAVMLITLFAGCDSKDNVYGSWESTVDVSETFAAEVLAEVTKNNPNMTQFFNFEGITVVRTLTFNEDGTYTSTVTKESFYAMMDMVATKMAEGFTAYAEHQKKELNIDMNLNEVFEVPEGKTLADTIKAAFKTEEFDNIVMNNSQSGVFKAEGGKLYVAADVESFDDNKYETFVISGDNNEILEITGQVGLSESETELIGKSYPMTFTKVVAEDVKE